MRVALVNMPFAVRDRPALGLSLLKAALRRVGVECDVFYPNLTFAGAVGPELYDRLAIAEPAWAMAGEVVFRRALTGRPDGEEELRHLLAVDWGLPAPDAEAVVGASRAAPTFVRSCLERVDWSGYGVVGFTSFCAQNSAALALARALKERHPGLVTVFGGPNWDGEMGRAQFAMYPFVDVVCVGEADGSFPDLVLRLARGDRQEVGWVGGLLLRDGGRIVDTGAPELVEDLDGLPAPDHEDYFANLDAEGQEQQPTTIGVEGSRGCWWAARTACLFCGQNGSSRRYRQKSAPRLLAELRAAADCPGCSGIDLVDNVVSREFLSKAVPQLGEKPLGVPIFFEARPDLTRRQVADIARIDAAIQVGIETLNDHVLDLMHKGSTALRNVRLLKWCKIEGLAAAWNLLYGLPGEKPEDYASLVELIPSLTHLQAPHSCGRVSLDRFSPYFERHESYGFRDVRPERRYAQVYGLEEADTEGFAYSFSHAAGDDLVTAAYIHRLRREVTAWKDAAPAELRLDTIAGRHVVRDTRAVAEELETEVDELDRALLSLCEDGLDEAVMVRRATVDAGVPDTSPDAVTERIARLRARRWVVPLSGKLLSLVVSGRGGAGAT